MAAEMGRSHEAPLIREPIACPPARWRRGLAGVARKEEGRRGDARQPRPSIGEVVEAGRDRPTEVTTLNLLEHR